MIGKMMLGSVIRESLQDPSPLNEFDPVYTEVEQHPEDPDATIWHVDWYLLNRDTVERLVDLLARCVRRNWYVHFFNRQELVVIMFGAGFWANPNDRSSWKKFIEYGTKVGVAPKWTTRVPIVPADHLLELNVIPQNFWPRN